MVTAKFRISRVTPLGSFTAGEKYHAPWGHEVEMTPDYANGANKAWSDATPSGVFRMTVTNEDALEHLPEGKSVTITISVDD